MPQSPLHLRKEFGLREDDLLGPGQGKASLERCHPEVHLGGVVSHGGGGGLPRLNGPTGNLGLLEVLTEGLTTAL